MNEFHMNLSRSKVIIAVRNAVGFFDRDRDRTRDGKPHHTKLLSLLITCFTPPPLVDQNPRNEKFCDKE